MKADFEWEAMVPRPGRNNIIAVTPMKFLPIKEFEKRQKSINRNQNLSIMSSMITKIGFLS